MSAHQTAPAPYTVSVAPMMDCTDRHFRYLARLFSPSVLLYTEMISAAAIVHGDNRALLAFHPKEHPLALQIGGGDPALCAQAVEIAERYGYDEYNLNVGCPSPKVQKGMFGAQLMADPNLVVRIVRAMRSVTARPITVKQRLGITPDYRYQDLARFCDTVATAADPQRFIVHARIALLNGLSPKENRTVPPIMYDQVYRLKRQFPHLLIEINGEIQSIESIRAHLSHVDGVMVGREAYANPALLLQIEQRIFCNPAHRVRTEQIIEQIKAYIIECEQRGVWISAHRICAHLSTLYYCQPGARRWRRALHSAITHAANAPAVGVALGQAIDSAYRQMVDAR